MRRRTLNRIGSFRSAGREVPPKSASRRSKRPISRRRSPWLGLARHTRTKDSLRSIPTQFENREYWGTVRQYRQPRPDAHQLAIAEKPYSHTLSPVLAVFELSGNGSQGVLRSGM